MRSFDDDRAIKAINLLFTKAGPVLSAISSQLQRPPPKSV